MVCEDVGDTGLPGLWQLAGVAIFAIYGDPLILSCLFGR
jgi:hypothetical protein